MSTPHVGVRLPRLPSSAGVQSSTNTPRSMAKKQQQQRKQSQQSPLAPGNSKVKGLNSVANTKSGTGGHNNNPGSNNLGTSQLSFQLPLSRSESSDAGRSEPKVSPRYYSKHVHAPWYSRYAKVLNAEERVKMQPRHELKEDELFNAMTQMYGKSYKDDLANQLADKEMRREMESRALRSYRKAKRTNGEHTPAGESASSRSVASRTSTVVSAITSTGASTKADLKGDDRAAEKKKMTVARLLESLRQAAGRSDSERESSFRSKWKALRSRRARQFFVKSTIETRKRNARQRFIRAVTVVKTINRFLVILLEKHLPALGTMLKPMDSADKDTQHKRMFDPAKYESQFRKSNDGLPADIALVLTKPWHRRSIDEIGEVVKCLYPHLVYHEYPMGVQLQLASVAWYTYLDKMRAIVREGNPATRFFIVISGAISVTEVTTGRCGAGETKLVRHFYKGDRFGDEEMDHIDCTRSYSAISASPCEIIAIDYTDYQESVAYFEPRTEVAPQHILYLEKFPLFMENAQVFPRSILLRATKTRKIQMFYFCRNAVVSRSLEKSSFVFIVLHGDCYTASRATTTKFNVTASGAGKKNEEQTASGRTHSQGHSKSISPHTTTCNLSNAIDPELLAKRNDVTTFSFMNSQYTQDFSWQIRSMTERCLSMSRDRLAKRIQDLHLMKLIGSVYSYGLIRDISLHLADKMLFQESVNREYLHEIKQIKHKTNKIKIKLARAKMNLENLAIVRRIVDLTDGSDPYPHSYAVSEDMPSLFGGGSGHGASKTHSFEGSPDLSSPALAADSFGTFNELTDWHSISNFDADTGDSKRETHDMQKAKNTFLKLITQGAGSVDEVGGPGGESVKEEKDHAETEEEEEKEEDTDSEETYTESETSEVKRIKLYREAKEFERKLAEEGLRPASQSVGQSVDLSKRVSSTDGDSDVSTTSQGGPRPTSDDRTSARLKRTTRRLIEMDSSNEHKSDVITSDIPQAENVENKYTTTTKTEKAGRKSQRVRIKDEKEGSYSTGDKRENKPEIYDGGAPATPSTTTTTTATHSHSSHEVGDKTNPSPHKPTHVEPAGERRPKDIADSAPTTTTSNVITSRKKKQSKGQIEENDPKASSSRANHHHPHHHHHHHHHHHPTGEKESVGDPESPVTAHVSNTHITKSPPQILAVFTKGDIIGNDYVDYNDGNFRTPKRDAALVSDGAELIMVQKSFLLERLYKHHRRIKDIPCLMNNDDDGE